MTNIYFMNYSKHGYYTIPRGLVGHSGYSTATNYLDMVCNHSKESVWACPEHPTSDIGGYHIPLKDLTQILDMLRSLGYSLCNASDGTRMVFNYDL